jgi:NAD(P)-dependent dehydrogenase (short-subunit alcohol dehydrogenase family)
MEFESIPSVPGQHSLPLLLSHGAANLYARAVATPILANSGNDASQVPLSTADSHDNALSRFGDPEELAQCLIWLTSGRASYVTAAVLAASGGQVGV